MAHWSTNKQQRKPSENLHIKYFTFTNFLRLGFICENSKTLLRQWYSLPLSLPPLQPQLPHPPHSTNSLLLDRSEELKAWLKLFLWVSRLHSGAHHGKEKPFGGHVVRVRHTRDVDVCPQGEGRGGEGRGGGGEGCTYHI